MNTKSIIKDDIEKLTQVELEEIKSSGLAELLIIKDCNCYFADLGGNFGYSVLVFKNNHHIFYADDYQLHHGNKSVEELKEYYINTLNNKFFTDSELLTEVKNYEEYRRKSYYIRNYWIMQFDRVSIFYIGKPNDKQLEAEEKMFYCAPCFCYVPNIDIVNQAIYFVDHLEKSFNQIKEDENIFREMISRELSNHEACYTGDYTDALNALGLIFEDLTRTQQKIVKEELKKQICGTFD